MNLEQYSTAATASATAPLDGAADKSSICSAIDHIWRAAALSDLVYFAVLQINDGNEKSAFLAGLGEIGEILEEAKGLLQDALSADTPHALGGEHG